MALAKPKGYRNGDETTPHPSLKLWRQVFRCKLCGVEYETAGAYTASARWTPTTLQEHWCGTMFGRSQYGLAELVGVREIKDGV